MSVHLQVLGTEYSAEHAGASQVNAKLNVKSFKNHITILFAKDSIVYYKRALSQARE